MIREIDAYYFNKEEPIGSFLLALRQHILNYDDLITETWTYRMPMFRYKGKLFCYLWIDKKTNQPYLGIYKGTEIEHPLLDLGNRNKMKVLHFNVEEDIPIDVIDEIFGMAVKLY